MAHLFDSGLFYGNPAWHKLGNVLPADSPKRFSIQDSIIEAGMNWSVSPEPVFVGGRVAEGYKAIVRSDNLNVLGVVSDKYKCLQNADMFTWFQPYLDTKEVAFETCGSLKDGSLVWILAKIQRENAVIRQNDEIEKYLLLSSSHDGSSAVSIGFNPVRVVCANTLAMALSNGSAMLRIRHHKHLAEGMAAARDAINLADQAFEATASEYRRLAECKVSASDLRNYVRVVLELPEDMSAVSTRQKNILERVCGLCTQNGNDGSSVWDGFNAITDYTSHFYGRNQEGRLRSLWFGESAKLNSRALTVAMQLAS